MKVIDRNISELIPAEYNPRFITDEQLEHLKASIQRFDAVEPVLINTHPDRKNIIISGHQRLKAAKALGMKKFPCVELNLDKDQERELNIRMNKNIGDWKWDSIVEFFKEDELTEWGFTEKELFGFYEEQIDGDEWLGMPEFKSEDAPPKIVINFNCESDRELFAKKYDFEFTKKESKTWSMWWPEKEKMFQDSSMKYE